MWKLDQALRVIRAVQPTTRRFGYHLTMGGGVLNMGESNKDLDLYFLPMGGFDDKIKHDPAAMLQYLEKLWGVSKPLAQTEEGRKRYGYGKGTISFYKHAVQFTRKGGFSGEIQQRIDCFIF